MNIAEFFKVSPSRFAEDLHELLDVADNHYAEIRLPQRATSGSAGYDFYAPVDICLEPGGTARIPTGIRCRIDDGYVLQLYPRSSMGFRYQMTLLNTVGVIDADYFNADNEGHIIVGITNNGNKTLTIKTGDRFVQGVFYRYHLAKEESNDKIRSGGFGSTG